MRGFITIVKLFLLYSLIYPSLFASEKPRPIQQVYHQPIAPRPHETVNISIKALENATNAQVFYQVVDPGNYIELRDAAYKTNWLSLKMNAKEELGIRRFEIAMPADMQVNRRLVRYRFLIQDASGTTHAIPSAKDLCPNFAYFVYAGVPAWTAAVNPQAKSANQRNQVTYDTNVMQRVQSYILIGKKRSIENVTWNEPTGDKEYRYTGTLVADGLPYDHVRMRARGGGWRYAMGKNMWKFDFSQSAPLAARDDYGRLYPFPWYKVNLRACIQQGDYGYRGEQGMFESVGFRLFNLAGAPAPATHWIQLRIITGAEENPANQYQGDYWGLYLAIEEVDGRFLQAHSLPDGNIYKMEGGSGTLSHNGSGAVTNRSDLDSFIAKYEGTQQPPNWWRANLNLPGYYAYRAICECIHHYDIGDGKNYYYCQNPATRRWEVFPWDIDLTWADSMYGGGDEPFKYRVLSHSSLNVEYQNRVREIRDLLFNPEETRGLIEECASIIADPAGGLSPVDADRAKWDYHPVMAMGGKAGQGLFYQAAPNKDFRGMLELMKNYVKKRGAWIDKNLLNDRIIPATPKLSYTGRQDFPANSLTFQAGEFSGSQAFSAIQWRLAEISPPQMVQGRAISPGKYEISPAWDSGELANTATSMVIPGKTISVGQKYRVRVRIKNASGHWSHWSEPIEFIAGAPISSSQ